MLFYFSLDHWWTSWWKRWRWGPAQERKTETDGKRRSYAIINCWYIVEPVAASSMDIGRNSCKLSNRSKAFINDCPISWLHSFNSIKHSKRNILPKMWWPCRNILIHSSPSFNRNCNCNWKWEEEKVLNNNFNWPNNHNLNSLQQMLLFPSPALRCRSQEISLAFNYRARV